jgi:hypothetical protein
MPSHAEQKEVVPMKRFFALTLAALVVGPLSLSCGLAQTGASTSPLGVHGSPVDPQDAQRVLVIQPNTRWVNVTQGETVRFVVAASQFSWRFDGLDGRSFDLQTIAPPGVLARTVTVYVTRNPGHGS